ncbi:hypothetical protein [Salinibacter phage M8CRM-1]|uniref:Uncharacterized protein n=1 Tax=Salinibacter phage M8CRM-1 TaxID=2681612 RepID=A0A2I6UGU5_9CAUD|nr:hypothetical protein FGG67_gp75 [Salinibacter phage M8CRM-1]AUO79137.1 hypothetical protein [Salinibacter phage M8CRM-1]
MRLPDAHRRPETSERLTPVLPDPPHTNALRDPLGCPTADAHRYAHRYAPLFRRNLIRNNLLFHAYFTNSICIVSDPLVVCVILAYVSDRYSTVYVRCLRATKDISVRLVVVVFGHRETGMDGVWTAPPSKYMHIFTHKMFIHSAALGVSETCIYMCVNMPTE